MKNFDEKLEKLIQDALAEDIGEGDHSTLSCIPPDTMGSATLKIKQDGIIAGLAVAQRIFKMNDELSSIHFLKKDGDEIRKGEVAFTVSAHIRTILQCERLVLNCMQRMSGIATLTNTYTTLLKGKHTRILDTRKTTPNFRLLEKEAVRIGGGFNHRFGLYDMIMLKDNHIDYCGGIKEAITRSNNYVRENKLPLKIEIETRNLDEVKEVLAYGKNKVFRVMLDNFSITELRDALTLINGQFETEASGGINLDNVVDYAETGVDFVSIGGLIHQAKSLDLSLKAEIV